MKRIAGVALLCVLTLTGCVKDRSAVQSESDSPDFMSEVKSKIITIDGEEITQFMLPYVAAYNYETCEVYNIYSDFNSLGINYDSESITFQGQKLRVPCEVFSYYNLNKADDRYSAEFRNATLSLSNIETGYINFKGIAFYEESEMGYDGWVLRPLFEDGDSVLPLISTFTEEEKTLVEEMSSIIIGGKEYKTHPFDIMYLALDEEYTKATMPDFKADRSRVYLVEGETESIELGLGYSSFYHAAPNTVFWANDIGEALLNN